MWSRQRPTLQYVPSFGAMGPGQHRGAGQGSWGIECLRKDYPGGKGECGRGRRRGRRRQEEERESEGEEEAEVGRLVGLALLRPLDLYIEK